MAQSVPDVEGSACCHILAYDDTYRAMSSWQGSPLGNHVSNDGLGKEFIKIK
jgi:hypothetical protein